MDCCDIERAHARKIFRSIFGVGDGELRDERHNVLFSRSLCSAAGIALELVCQ